MRKLFFLLLFLCTILVACAPDRIHTIQAYDEWGRGRQVGRLYAQTQLGLAVTPDGSQVALLYGSRENDPAKDQLHLTVVATNGDITFDGELAIAIGEPRSMQLLANNSGELELFWFDGFREERTIRYAKVKPDGTVMSDALTVQSESGIYWYKASWTTEQRLQLLWVSNAGQLFSAFVEGEAIGEQTALLEGVLSADYQLDNNGALYLAWTEQINEQQRQFFFTLLLEAGPIVDKTPIELFGADESEARGVVGGPAVTLDRTHVYVAWTRRQSTPVGVVDRISLSTLLRSDAGNVNSREFSEPAGLDLIPLFPPPSTPATGAFPYQSLGIFNSDLVGAAQNNGVPATLAGEHQEAILTLASNYNTRSRSEMQPSLFYLRDGEAIGYQPLTWTDKRSSRVITVSDDNENLYTAWYDSDSATDNFPVYLMTTNPEMNSAAAGLTLSDIGYLFVDFMGRVGNGISLVFVTLAWPFMGFAAVFIAYWFNEGELYDRRGYIVLGISVLIYLASKMLFLSDISRSLPGLAFVSPGMAIALIYLVPLGITLLSSLFTYVTYLRKMGGDLSVMRAALQIILIDYAISMAVYSIGRFE